MSKTTNYEKIPENLKKLKDEAVEKGSELAESVNSGYELLKDKKDAAISKFKDGACTVNDSVHSHPWAYIGGAAVLGLVVGRFFRRC